MFSYIGHVFEPMGCQELVPEFSTIHRMRCRWDYREERSTVLLLGGTPKRLKPSLQTLARYPGESFWAAHERQSLDSKPHRLVRLSS
jgi:hypothetical protein